LSNVRSPGFRVGSQCRVQEEGRKAVLLGHAIWLAVTDEQEPQTAIIRSTGRIGGVSGARNSPA
jgi:hypothetical protein